MQSEIFYSLCQSENPKNLEEDSSFELQYMDIILGVGRDRKVNKGFSLVPATALPVTFKREIQRLVVIEGESGVFCCELSKPSAPVEWRKGRVVLKPGDKYEMKQEGRLTKLVINDIEESDAGKYTCKTKDSQSSAELTVQGETGSSWTISLIVLISDFVKHCLFLL